MNALFPKRSFSSSFSFFLLLGLLMISFLVLMTGCALDDDEQGESAIPWNKPASWEGGGALGAMGFEGTH